MVVDALHEVGERERKVTPSRHAAGWMAAYTLAERELVRFFRQRNRVVGALGQPLVFWLIFGQGLRASFQPAGAQGLSYSQYFFPGVVVLIVLFTAIFATISIIEDRREGFLQEVLIAPAPRSMVVLGKVLGGTALAVLQAWAFLLLAPLAGFSCSLGMLVGLSLHLAVVGVALTSLGVCLAWRMDSTQGFHAIMSVFLMPLWLLSGAFFPAEGAPTWLAWTIRLNPVTYAVAGVRGFFHDKSLPTSAPGLVTSILVSLAFAGIMLGLACWMARDPKGGK